MEIKIDDAEISVKKVIHTNGVIFGMKKWAGRTALVVVLAEGAKGAIENDF